MFGIGPTELIIIMFLILLIFGAKKLPELAQGLGKGIREFKKATTEIQDEINLDTPPKKAKPKTKSTENTGDDSGKTSNE